MFASVSVRLTGAGTCWSVGVFVDGLGVCLRVNVNFEGVGCGMSWAIWRSKPKQGGQVEPILLPGVHNSDRAPPCHGSRGTLLLSPDFFALRPAGSF